MNNRSNNSSSNPRSATRNSAVSQAMNKLESNIHGSSDGKQNLFDNNKALSDALAQTGGNGLDKIMGNSSAQDYLQNGDFTKANPGQQADLERQREEMERKQKYEQQRRELHKKVNPVEQTEVFNAREAEVEKKIESLRQELKLLAKDVKEFNKEIDMTLMDEVKNPGMEGTYYINFFEKLKKFIILMRKKIKSARTWARQMSSKQKKKKRKKGPGLAMEGASKSEKTSTVHQMMNGEVGGTYGSG